MTPAGVSLPSSGSGAGNRCSAGGTGTFGPGFPPHVRRPPPEFSDADSTNQPEVRPGGEGPGRLRIQHTRSKRTVWGGPRTGGTAELQPLQPPGRRPAAPRGPAGTGEPGWDGQGWAGLDGSLSHHRARRARERESLCPAIPAASAEGESTKGAGGRCPGLAPDEGRREASPAPAATGASPRQRHCLGVPVTDGRGTVVWERCYRAQIKRAKRQQPQNVTVLQNVRVCVRENLSLVRPPHSVGKNIQLKTHQTCPDLVFTAKYSRRKSNSVTSK